MRPNRYRRSLPLGVVLVIAMFGGGAVVCFAKKGAFHSSAHGDAINGPRRRNGFPAGSCVQCHDVLHASHAAPPQAYDRALFAPDTNDLCFTCHSLPSRAGIYPATGTWLQSTHARSPNVYLSGTNSRPSSDANKCVNCHDPHAVKDASGVIPSMLAAREALLCQICHDGSRARDLTREFSKPYHHPIGSLKHRAGERKPADFAARHSECADCHNAHVAGADPAPPSPPQASNRLAGVSRVQVANGGAGAAPNYMFRTADDTSLANEFEICFKCHSSWTVQNPGQSDLALLTNPANPSYHPIQAAGKNPNIDSRAFNGMMNAQSVILCSDCHRSDDPALHGPHGSSYRYILKKPSTSTTLNQTMQPNDICFDCHVYDVYANGAGSSSARYSRFSGGAGHIFHVVTQRIPCYGCHETHGSTRFAALIARRTPGITGYSQTTSGGTCTPSCHGQETYTVAYSR